MSTHKRSASVGGSPHQGAAHTEHTVLVQRTDGGFGMTLNEMGRIASVDLGSPAETAGLQKFDRISHVDGVPLSDSASLSDCIVGKEEVLFGVERPPMSLHRDIAAKENRLAPVARAATIESRRPASGSRPPWHRRNSSDPPNALAVRSLALALSEATGWGAPAVAPAAAPDAAPASADGESISESNSEAGSARKRSAAARLFRRSPTESDRIRLPRPEPVAIAAELAADHLAVQPQGSPSTFEHV